MLLTGFVFRVLCIVQVQGADFTYHKGLYTEMCIRDRGYTVTYAVGNTLLIIWGVVIVLLI